MNDYHEKLNEMSNFKTCKIFKHVVSETSYIRSSRREKEQKQ